MRFGIRIGPFWASTSTRRRSRSYQGIFRDEHGREHRCEHNHRSREAAQECARQKSRKHAKAVGAAEAARFGRMSPEEYRQRLMDADPEWAAQVHRKEAAIQAEAEADLKKMKDELADPDPDL